ncbi:Ubiquitin-like protein 7 [Bagarius yarrelli]|uniref:Ubiquitin-like protein 7 n=1 Tax=Bagarius yarrelli TaxID=175774 RepID=A0A556U175_BAGYA|nr:Ubiquitin-like protein 7 [Bagarius yarrelli]
MENPFWHLSLKLHDRPKSVLPFPEDVEPGGYMVATIKQLVSAQLPDSLPDPELIELVHCGCKLKDDLTLDSYGIKSGSTLHILKKVWPEPEVKPGESIVVIINVIFIIWCVLQDKDLFVQFTDPSLLDVLVHSHPSLVNAIILILHSVTSSMPSQSNASSSSNAPASSYSEMPGGFLFEGMSDDEDDFQSGSRSSQRLRPPTNLGSGGATGPRPITQSELATALALANTPESSAPVLGSQGHRWQTQMQQLRDMGIRDEVLALRALQATDGDLQAALELIFAGGGGL